MPPQEFAFAAPTQEEMTRVAAVGVGAAITGAVEGTLITMSPKLGALEVPFTWGVLLATPAIGAVGALMTKGMLSDLGLGIAAGGSAIVGYVMPAMLEEFTLAKSKGGNQLTAEQRAALAARSGNKMLPAGGLNAALRAQELAARSGSRLEV